MTPHPPNRPRRHRAVLLACLGLAAACGDGGPGALGTLERDRVEVVAPASERILEIAVTEGTAVAAGDLLLRLDGERLGRDLDRATSERAAANAALAEAEHGPRREAVARARAALAAAESSLATAERELERARSLRERGIVAEAELDLRRTRRDTARAERDRAGEQLAELEAGTREEQLARARATAGAAEAAAARAAYGVAELEVRAPVAGVVDALPFEPGGRPRAGDTVAVLLAEGAPYARVYVPATARPHLVIGQELQVEVAGVDQSFPGRLRRIAREPMFTPYFALTERDRSRLSWLAEVQLAAGPATRDLPAGLPVRVRLPEVTP